MTDALTCPLGLDPKVRGEPHEPVNRVGNLYQLDAREERSSTERRADGNVRLAAFVRSSCTAAVSRANRNVSCRSGRGLQW